MGGSRVIAGIVLPVLLLGVVSCRPWREPSDPVERDRRDILTLEVQNHHFNEVVVYYLPDGVRHRIGTVRGVSSRTFELHPHLAARPGGVRLLISPIGSREAYLSDPIYASEGDLIVMVVASRLRMSHWYLR